MLLRSVDLELAYWRVRRSAQSLRQALRYRASQVRMHWRLWRMHRRTVTANQEPEDSFLFRSIFFVCLAFGVLVLLVDSVTGQDGLHSVLQAGLIISMWG